MVVIGLAKNTAIQPGLAGALAQLSNTDKQLHVGLKINYYQDKLQVNSTLLRLPLY